MPDATARDRLYPSLLDRLTDDEPHKAAEPADARAFNMSRLRESVLRDLNWLFNATRSSDALETRPHLRRAVVNFGLPAFSGRPASSLDLAEVARALRQTILDFEPRLIADSVRVVAEPAKADSAHNIVTFRIEARLWSQPIPLEIFLRTDMDLESGQTRVIESGG